MSERLDDNENNQRRRLDYGAVRAHLAKKAGAHWPPAEGSGVRVSRAYGIAAMVQNREIASSRFRVPPVVPYRNLGHLDTGQIEEALTEARGNVSAAARKLGVS